jgi:hypothetical protein
MVPMQTCLHPKRISPSSSDAKRWMRTAPITRGNSVVSNTLMGKTTRDLASEQITIMHAAKQSGRESRRLHHPQRKSILPWCRWHLAPLLDAKDVRRAAHLA